MATIAHRLTFDASRKQWCFTTVVVPAIALSSRGSILEGYVVLRDELHEFCRRVGNDAIRVITALVVDALHAQCPNYLNARAAVGHSRVTQLRKRGTPGDLQTQWIGHSSLQTTDLYSHTDEELEYRREAAKKVGPKLVIGPNGPKLCVETISLSA